MDDYPEVGSIYKSMGAKFRIDKIDPDGWIFITNTKSQARHRLKLEGFKKRYTYVSHGV